VMISFFMSDALATPDTPHVERHYQHLDLAAVTEGQRFGHKAGRAETILLALRPTAALFICCF
jgi:hypothetical protein